MSQTSQLLCSAQHFSSLLDVSSIFNHGFSSTVQKCGKKDANIFRNLMTVQLWTGELTVETVSWESRCVKVQAWYWSTVVNLWTSRSSWTHRWRLEPSLSVCANKHVTHQTHSCFYEMNADCLGLYLVMSLKDQWLKKLFHVRHWSSEGDFWTGV